jgi:hypothetical protein
MILENKEQGVATNTEQGVATNTEQGVATPCSKKRGRSEREEINF